MNHQFFKKFLLLAAALTSVPAGAEQLLTATCGKLSGTKVQLVKGVAKTTPDSKDGPIFFVDSSNPGTLVSLWKFELFGKKTTDKYEASVVELSDDKLQAIERDANGLYLYTIFLKTGTLLYSHHRLHSLLDDVPSLLSFVGKCDIKVGR